MLVLGIDAHKRTHTVVAIDSAGRKLGEKITTATTTADHLDMLRWAEQFGPERCMFESNFPVDRLSLSYRTFWNAAKKLVADFSPDERDAMLRGTAARVYRLV